MYINPEYLDLDLGFDDLDEIAVGSASESGPQEPQLQVSKVTISSLSFRGLAEGSSAG